MRVLLTTSFQLPGTTGSPRLTMEVVAGLRAAGSDVVVVRYAGWRRLRTRTRAWEGTEVHDVPALALPVHLWRLTRRHRIEVVDAQGLLGAEVGVLASVLGRVPLVVEYHEVPHADAATDGGVVRRAVHRLTAALVRRRTAEVVVLSERERHRAEAAGWAAPGHAHVLYPAADDAFFDQGPPRGVPEHDPCVGYVGNFLAWQGIDLLLDAVPRVWAARPDVRFALWGATDDDRAALAARLPDDERLVVHGRVPAEEVPAVLAGVDVLTIPRPDLPQNSTTGKKLGEYLAVGRVVVATDVADHRVLLDGDDPASAAGLVVPATTEGVADGILTAVEDRERAAVCARNAAALARERFRLDAGTARRLDLFRTAVAGRRRPTSTRGST